MTTSPTPTIYTTGPVPTDDLRVGDVIAIEAAPWTLGYGPIVAIKPYVSTVAPPGEDRTFGTGLFVDLVPRSCWFTNVRSCVSELDWERLRRPILRRAGHRCEACGDGEDRATGRRLEVHERWHYNNDTGVQTLRRLICLCSPCHLVTHLGYAGVTGRAEEALAHLRRVNGWDDGKAYGHVYASEQQWLHRSARTWTLDLSMLTGAGITVRRPQSAAERPAAAERALRAANAGVSPRQHRLPPAPPELVPSPTTPSSAGEPGPDCGHA